MGDEDGGGGGGGIRLRALWFWNSSVNGGCGGLLSRHGGRCPLSADGSRVSVERGDFASGDEGRCD